MNSQEGTIRLTEPLRVRDGKYWKKVKTRKTKTTSVLLCRDNPGQISEGEGKKESDCELVRIPR